MARAKGERPHGSGRKLQFLRSPNERQRPLQKPACRYLRAAPEPRRGRGRKIRSAAERRALALPSVHFVYQRMHRGARRGMNARIPQGFIRVGPEPAMSRIIYAVVMA